jgi:hypothetical protein
LKALGRNVMYSSLNSIVLFFQCTHRITLCCLRILKICRTVWLSIDFIQLWTALKILWFYLCHKYFCKKKRGNSIRWWSSLSIFLDRVSITNSSLCYSYSWGRKIWAVSEKLDGFGRCSSMIFSQTATYANDYFSLFCR